jgi:hypothetical protein
MQPRTEATLADLQRAHWFENVGVKDTDAADILGSWSEAVASCASPLWEEICTEAQNQYRARLAERNPQFSASQWNEAVRQLRPVTEKLVESKARDLQQRHSLPQVFVDCVRWDVLGLCLESEFAEVYPPGFFASQGYWYVKGHFPCGWRGPFPKGRLIIY